MKELAELTWEQIDIDKEIGEFHRGERISGIEKP